MCEAWLCGVLRLYFTYLQRYRIFFPGKTLCPTHSLDFGQSCIFFPKTVFFSGPNFSILAILFFFYQEKFRIHSLSQINQPEKKYSTGKKNPSFSLTHSIFPRKWQKLNFSREIKNYGTFVTCYDNKLNRVIFKLSY